MNSLLYLVLEFFVDHSTFQLIEVIKAYETCVH